MEDWKGNKIWVSTYLLGKVFQYLVQWYFNDFDVEKSCFLSIFRNQREWLYEKVSSFYKDKRSQNLKAEIKPDYLTSQYFSAGWIQERFSRIKELSRLAAELVRRERQEVGFGPPTLSPRVGLLLWCGVRYRYSRHDLILIALDYFGPFCQCNEWCSIENSAPHKLWCTMSRFLKSLRTWCCSRPALPTLYLAPALTLVAALRTGPCT